MLRNFFQIDQVAGVGKAIQVDQAVDLGPINNMMDHIRSDKSRAAGDQKIHVTLLLCCWSGISSHAASLRRLPAPDGFLSRPPATWRHRGRNWIAAFWLPGDRIPR